MPNRVGVIFLAKEHRGNTEIGLEIHYEINLKIWKLYKKETLCEQEHW